MSFNRLFSEGAGLLAFLAAFVLGVAIFLIFGQMAGIFTSGKGLVASFKGSPAGWIALFGATLIVSAPIIGLSIWGFDRLVKSMTEKNEKQ